jgi:hypothetical protein
MRERRDPIDEFWRWWATAKDPLAAAISSRVPSSLVGWGDTISARVDAIDPALAWELGPGVRSEHHFALSSAGDSRLRIVTERWLARAPAADALWEYYPAKQPGRADPKVESEIEGVSLRYAEFRLALQTDEMRLRVHAAVYHPKLRELDEGNRTVATFLMLDDLLGEDAVERWVGRVTTVLDPGGATEPREALRAAVAKLTELSQDRRWTLLEGRDLDGKRRIAAVDFGVRRLDHLLMESHVEVTIGYPAREDDFYPEAMSEDVNAMEDALVQALGPHAVRIGRETGAGRRVIHLHVAPAGPAQEILARWERMYPTWDIDVVAQADPSWSILNRW